MQASKDAGTGLPAALEPAYDETVLAISLKVRQQLSQVEVVLADRGHQAWLEDHGSLICDASPVASSIEKNAHLNPGPFGDSKKPTL